MNSWFSAAFMSSPKWMERSCSAAEYSVNAASPPGKELWVPPMADVTSQGRSRDVTDMTVSRLPDSNCFSCAGKASIDA